VRQLRPGRVLGDACGGSARAAATAAATEYRTRCGRCSARPLAQLLAAPTHGAGSQPSCICISFAQHTYGSSVADQQQQQRPHPHPPSARSRNENAVRIATGDAAAGSSISAVSPGRPCCCSMREARLLQSLACGLLLSRCVQCFKNFCQRERGRDRVTNSLRGMQDPSATTLRQI
jgi:hypothetical protein